MQRLAILGSTGSIGTATLEVTDHLQGAFRIVVLSARSNGRLLARQVLQCKPEIVAFTGEPPGILREACAETNSRLVTGIRSATEAANWPSDVVLNAIVGAAGLIPTLEALNSGKRVALANKESLVIGGNLVMAATNGDRDRLIPVDSEHASLHAALNGRSVDHVRSLWLTASGGALRDYKGRLEDVSVQQALAHPTWKMGNKITIDSATMMNKGLELIEAHHLFEMQFDAIHCLQHRQSMVHCLVELTDGSLLAHLAWPDMRGPIQYALTYPTLQPTGLKPLISSGLPSLDFEEIDLGRFPCLRLAREAGMAGGTAMAVLNAANEVAVELFLAGAVTFADISRVIDAVLQQHSIVQQPCLDEVIATDSWAREQARHMAKLLQP